VVVPLAHQDRRRYDADLVREARGLLDRALAARRPGPYQVQAAIACLHASAERAEDTDWAQIAALYGALVRMAPSPMAELARATAVGMASGPDAGLALVDALRGPPWSLDGHHVLHATRGELLRRAGRVAEAREALARALALTPSRSPDRDLLRMHLAEIAPGDADHLRSVSPLAAPRSPRR
jgi:RNA polymerase sigma-70 factor (ECF subfamily)